MERKKEEKSGDELNKHVRDEHRPLVGACHGESEADTAGTTRNSGGAEAHRSVVQKRPTSSPRINVRSAEADHESHDKAQQRRLDDADSESGIRLGVVRHAQTHRIHVDTCTQHV